MHLVFVFSYKEKYFTNILPKTLDLELTQGCKITVNQRKRTYRILFE